MIIIFDPKVEEYLSELTEVLYKENYFGFKENAYRYVDNLIDTIIESIANMPSKQASPYFSKFGKNMDYIVLKKNNNTQWYVFFNYENDIFYIRYIGNNYTCAQHLL